MHPLTYNWSLDMRFALSLGAALCLLAAASDAADGVRPAVHMRPMPAATTGAAAAVAESLPETTGVGKPSGRVVQPTPLARRGTLFGSVYRGDNDPVNPNLLRHAAPNRSRRKAITW